ncbi:MAG: AcrB/AcrD/AcrF family protein, partial [Sphingomonas sp.]
GTVALFLGVSAIAPRLLIAAALGETATAAETAAEAEGAACLAPSALAALDALPAGTVLGFIDSTPALLLHTHHRGLAGPYHRNGRAIADTMRAWGGTPAQARAIISRHRIAYVIACGEPDEARVYDDRAPEGFHARLMRGETPAWLTPVRGLNTPWRIWVVSRPLPGSGAGA